MTEEKIMQRITRLETRKLTYAVGEPAPRKGAPVVRKIGQINEGSFRIDLDSFHTTIGDSDIERVIRRFIVVFNADSIDIEEMDGPKIITRPEGIVT